MNDRNYYAWRDCPKMRSIYRLGDISPFRKHDINWRLKALEDWQLSCIEPKIGVEPVVKGLLWRAIHWNIDDLKADILKVAKHLDFYDLASDELINMIQEVQA